MNTMNVFMMKFYQSHPSSFKWERGSKGLGVRRYLIRGLAMLMQTSQPSLESGESPRIGTKTPASPGAIKNSSYYMIGVIFRDKR